MSKPPQPVGVHLRLPNSHSCRSLLHRRHHERKDAEPTNLLLIVVDDLGYGDLEVMGTL